MNFTNMILSQTQQYRRISLLTN